MTEPKRPRPTYRDRVLAKIRRYDVADRAEVAQFHATLYGPDSFLSRPDYLEWMFERGPANEEPSPLWLFRSGDELHGQQAGVRTVVRVGGRDLEGLWATDLFVRPEFQLRGIGAVLSEVLIDSCSVTMATEVSDTAKQAFDRAGWLDLGITPRYVRPIDIAAVISGKQRNLPPWLVAIGNRTLGATDVALGALFRALRYRLQEVQRFDRRADEIWRDASPHYSVIGRRNADWLNWRFAEFPVDGYYQLYYLMRGSQTVGYAVLHVETRDNIERAEIVDFLCPPRVAFPLLVLCAVALRRAGADVIFCIHQPGRLRRAFRLAGYLLRTTGWPFMVTSRGLSEHEQALIAEPSNWYVTFGDSNTHHPREGTVYAN